MITGLSRSSAPNPATSAHPHAPSARRSSSMRADGHSPSPPRPGAAPGPSDAGKCPLLWLWCDLFQAVVKLHSVMQRLLSHSACHFAAASIRLWQSNTVSALQVGDIWAQCSFKRFLSTQSQPHQQFELFVARPCLLECLLQQEQEHSSGKELLPAIKRDTRWMCCSCHFDSCSFKWQFAWLLVPFLQCSLLCSCS